MRDASVGPRWSSRRTGLVLALPLAGLLAARLVQEGALRIGLAPATADYAAGWTLALVLAAWLMSWPLPSSMRRLLTALWCVRLLVVLGFMLLYESQYSGLDAYGYYLEPRQGLGAGPWDPWDGTANVKALAWLQLQLLPDSFQALKVTFAMIGQVASYVLYRAFATYDKASRPWLLGVVSLFPSMVFWGSTVGKDPIILLGMSLAVWALLPVFASKRPHVLAAVAGIAIVTLIRPWMTLLLLVPGLWIAERGLRARFPRSSRLSITVLGGMLAVVAIFLLGMKFHLTSGTFLEGINRWSQAAATGGSAQPALQFDNYLEFLAFLPFGAFTALFRPLPGEILDPLAFGLLAGLDSLLLVALVLLAWRRGNLAALREPAVLCGLLMVVLWAFLYSIPSSQNLGTTSRYRMQIVPLILGVALFLAKPRPRPPAVTSATVPVPSGNLDAGTVAGFGYEWSHFDQRGVPLTELEATFAKYFSEFPWPRLPKDAVGFDVGCGTGRWAQFVAPRVGTLHCIDASPAALDVARRTLSNHPNCVFHEASVADMPVPDSAMDFGYSLGVLHHVPDPQAALASCLRKLKPGAPFLVYLYYALDGRPDWFRGLWRASNATRRVISRLPHPARLLISTGIATTVYWPLARASRFLERRGRNVSNIPLSIYRNASFYTMRTDALDRFGTVLEHRFTRADIARMLAAAGFVDIRFREGEPYWCAVAHRPV
ncbi:MAG: class I SAM-dependent methyltransferase [Thermoplasmatota archaeon]